MATDVLAVAIEALRKGRVRPAFFMGKDRMQIGL